MVYRRSPEMINVFERWRDLYRDFLSDRPDLVTNDQPFFRAAAYLGNAKIATLGREYNCKFRGQGYLNGPVKLLHGHVKFQMKRDYMDRVAGLMNRSLKPRVYVVGVFMSNKLLDTSGLCASRIRLAAFRSRFRSGSCGHAASKSYSSANSHPLALADLRLSGRDQ